ncbi:unnamed protein product [Blepharisma stoltei]|uniref:dolichol kinase n=1 Tax=Blepharisma stoltei TaxID=1481888 RepID=A0AAU9KD57_9CILI|nr:unnamed protein product [Blepharisma stoltei]
MDLLVEGSLIVAMNEFGIMKSFKITICYILLYFLIDFGRGRFKYLSLLSALLGKYLFTNAMTELGFLLIWFGIAYGLSLLKKSFKTVEANILGLIFASFYMLYFQGNLPYELSIPSQMVTSLGFFLLFLTLNSENQFPYIIISFLAISQGLYLIFDLKLIAFILLHYSMITTWAITTILGVIAVYFCKANFKLHPMVIRKLFHFLILQILLPGIFQDPILTSVAFLMAFWGFLMVETLRHIKIFGFLNEFLNSFIDTRDLGEVIVTHVYLLFGCGVPIIIGNFSNKNLLVMCSGLISLGIGDSMASLFGVKFGKKKWPKRKKTYIGTLAGWISMIIFAKLIGFELNLILIGALGIISLYETYTLLIDNLVLPLFSCGLVLLLNSVLYN